MAFKRGRKPCRAYDGFFPAGVNIAKVPGKTMFGPIQEIRTVMISGNMYLTVKVPRIEALDPQFVYVNVAWYDTGESKFHELARIAPEAPPI